LNCPNKYGSYIFKKDLREVMQDFPIIVYEEALNNKFSAD